MRALGLEHLVRIDRQIPDISGPLARAVTLSARVGVRMPLGGNRGWFGWRMGKFEATLSGPCIYLLSKVIFMCEQRKTSVRLGICYVSGIARQAPSLEDSGNLVQDGPV